MPKLEWKESYNVHTSQLGIVTLVVNWTSEGYESSVQGVHQVTLSKKVQNLEEAKQRAVALGVKKLQEALAKLS